MTRHLGLVTRRQFIKTTAGSAAVVSGAGAILPATESRSQGAGGTTPWYRRAYLWGQTNITEKDPVRYDIDWWRGYWKRTQVQAVIINAGGIVAYYPSKFPLHHRAEFLGERDLFGDLTKAAHADGIFVMARMDSNRTAEDFFKAHPDWFARDVNGQPYRAADKYCALRFFPTIVISIGLFRVREALGSVDELRDLIFAFIATTALDIGATICLILVITRVTDNLRGRAPAAGAETAKPIAAQFTRM